MPISKLRPPEAALPSAELGSPYVRAELPATAIIAPEMAADLPRLNSIPLSASAWRVPLVETGGFGLAAVAGAVAAGAAGVVVGKKLA